MLLVVVIVIAFVGLYVAPLVHDLLQPDRLDPELEVVLYAVRRRRELDQFKHGVRRNGRRLLRELDEQLRDRDQS